MIMVINSEENSMDDVATTLRSELAALQYKRDHLLVELQEVNSKLRSKESKIMEMEKEIDYLKEQQARHNAVIASLRIRIQELEEKDAQTSTAFSQLENELESNKWENLTNKKKVNDLEKKLSRCEAERDIIQLNARKTENIVNDLSKHLYDAAGAHYAGFSDVNTTYNEAKKIIDDISVEKNKLLRTTSSLSFVECELKICKEKLDKALSELDASRRQSTSYRMEIDRLSQEKENLEVNLRSAEREVAELQDKISSLNSFISTSISEKNNQEITINSLKEKIIAKEEEVKDAASEMTHFLESLSIITSNSDQFVEPQPKLIKERVREIVQQYKENQSELEKLKEKYSSLCDVNGETFKLRILEGNKAQTLEERVAQLDINLHRTQNELSVCRLTKERLQQDKNSFVKFLDKLSQILNTDEITKDVGTDMHTEAILMRAEQLAKLEMGKCNDKTAVVYQLQRRIRTLREQLQRRDLHLDLLRKKINVQDDNSRMRIMLENDKEEANIKIKRLQKQIEKLQSQMNDSRATIRELNIQLNDTDQYKLKINDMALKSDELRKRLMESETLQTRYIQKIASLKQQIIHLEQDNSIKENEVKYLKDELCISKQRLSEVNHSISLLSDFRNAIKSLLLLDSGCGDGEALCRLSKLVNAHREFTSISKRYVDDPLSSSPQSTIPCKYTEYDQRDFEEMYNKRPIHSNYKASIMPKP